MLGILGIILIVVGIALFIWERPIVLFMGMLLVGFILMSMFVHPVSYIEYQTFLRQKEYLNTHVAKSEVENAALTAKKIELNNWLYSEQVSIWFPENFYLFLPDGFMEETPIE